MEPLATGIQLADENLGRRPARFVSDAQPRAARRAARRSTTPRAASTRGWDGRDRDRGERPTGGVPRSGRSTPPDAARCWRRSSAGRSTRRRAARRDGSTACSTRRRCRSRPAGAALPDGVGYVAVRTAMPGVSGEMVDWWFDWHPRDPLRYRVWHPLAHTRQLARARRRARRRQSPLGRRPPPGRGRRHRQRARPDRLRAADASSASPATRSTTRASRRSSCGYAGDDRRRVRHTPMVHVFLATATGSCSAAASGSAPRCAPTCPAPLAASAARLLNRPAVRRARAAARRCRRALARHCAEEYANLAALLPELYGRFV